MKRSTILLLLAGCCGPNLPPAPDDIAYMRWEAANRFYAEGRWAEAAPEFEYVTAKRDRVRDAWWRLSECREKLGDRAGAAAAMAGWLRVDPTDDEARGRHQALIN